MPKVTQYEIYEKAIGEIEVPYDQIENTRQAAEVFYEVMKGSDRERKWVMLVDSDRRIQGLQEVFVGNTVMVAGRRLDLLKLAVIKNTAFMIVAHNHPSGGTNPSKADIEAYLQLKKAAELIGIELVDSLIVGRFPEEYSSVRVCVERKETPSVHGIIEGLLQKGSRWGRSIFRLAVYSLICWLLGHEAYEMIHYSDKLSPSELSFLLFLGIPLLYIAIRCIFGPLDQPVFGLSERD